MADKIPTTEADTGKQVQPRRRDAGSGANETTDGLDTTTESLRHFCRRHAVRCLARGC
jgi:hypothetical protein